MFQTRQALCVWPGMRQLCLRKNLLYGFMQLFSIPFKTFRAVRRSLRVSHLCSIAIMSSSLQIELVSSPFIFIFSEIIGPMAAYTFIVHCFGSLNLELLSLNCCYSCCSTLSFENICHTK